MKRWCAKHSVSGVKAVFVPPYIPEAVADGYQEQGLGWEPDGDNSCTWWREITLCEERSEKFIMWAQLPQWG